MQKTQHLVQYLDSKEGLERIGLMYGIDQCIQDHVSCRLNFLIQKGVACEFVNDQYLIGKWWDGWQNYV